MSDFGYMNGKALQAGDKIKLYMLQRSESGRNCFSDGRTFAIDKCIGEGASFIAYEALMHTSLQEKTIGVLKQFKMISGIPDGENLDIESYEDDVFPDNPDIVQQRINFFVRHHRALNEMKNSNTKLNTFLPNDDLFFSRDNTGNIEGLYVWDPDQKKTTFEEIVMGFHDNPKENPEGKLRFILESRMINAERVHELHKCGYLLLDNKPSNSGYKVLNKPLVETECLFDTEGITRISDVRDNKYGTEGFKSNDLITLSAPPAAKVKVDVYSCGCILYWALTKKIYSDSKFGHIGKDVANAPLIAALRDNAWPDLSEKLTKVLEMSLGIKKRYSSCEQFMKALADPLEYLCGEVNMPFSEGWNRALYQDQYWCMDFIEKDAPAPLAYFYHRLYESVRNANVACSLMSIRETTVMMLRIPSIILFYSLHEIGYGKIRGNKYLEEFYRKPLQVMTLRDWGWCAKIAYLLKKNDYDFGDGIHAAICCESINYLSRMWESLRINSPETASVNLLEWCLDSTQQGCLAIGDGEMYPEIPYALEAIRNMSEAGIDYYKKIYLTDTGERRLHGWDAKTPNTRIKICSAIPGENGALDCHSFFTGDESISCFDAYIDGRAYLLNCVSGKSVGEPELGAYLRQHENTIKANVSMLSGNDIFAENLESRDIDILNEKYFFEEEIIEIGFLYQWMEEFLEHNKKGLGCLIMPRGTGKSAFCRSILRIAENSSPKQNRSSFVDDITVCVYHFSDYLSRRDVFIPSVQSQLMELNPPRKGRNANVIRGELDRRWRSLSLDESIDIREQFAECLNKTLEYYRSSASKFQTGLLLVLDAIDEADVESVLTLLPREDMLDEGVYLLVTSRPCCELENHSLLCRFLEERSFTEKLEFDGEERVTLSRVNEGSDESFITGNYTEAVEIYVRNILMMSNGSEPVEADVKQAASYFEYRFSDLAAWRKLCMMNPSAFSNCYRGSKKDLFEVYMQELDDKAPKAYVEGISNMFIALVWAKEGLGIRELAFLSGQPYVSYNTKAQLADMMPFISVLRTGEQGNRYKIAHAEWTACINERFPDLEEIMRKRCAKLSSSMAQHYTEENIADIIHMSHRGELWLLVHMMELYRRYWPEYRNYYWKQPRIDREEKVIRLMLDNKDVRKAYVESYKNNEQQGVRNILLTLLREYYRTINELNQFSKEKLLYFDFQRKQIGDFISIADAQEKFFENTFREYASEMSETKRCIMICDAGIVARIAATVWGPETYRIKHLEKSWQWYEMLEEGLDEAESIDYQYAAENKFYNRVEMLIELGQTEQAMKALEELSEGEEDGVVEISDNFRLIRLFLKLGDLMNPKCEYADRRIIWNLRYFNAYEMNEASSLYSKAFEMLGRVLLDENDAGSLMVKYEVLKRVGSYCNTLYDAVAVWEEARITIECLSQINPEIDFSSELKQCYIGLGYASSEVEEKLRYVQLAEQICKDKELDSADVAELNTHIYKRYAAAEEYKEIRKIRNEYREMEDSRFFDAGSAMLILRYAVKEGKLTDDNLALIPKEFLWMLERGSETNYRSKIIDDPSKTLEDLLEECQRDDMCAAILCYMNDNYIHNEWLQDTCIKLDQNSRMHKFIAAHARVCNMLDRYISKGKEWEFSNIQITPTICGDVIWRIRQFPKFVTDQIPREVIEGLIASSDQYRMYGEVDFGDQTDQADWITYQVIRKYVEDAPEHCDNEKDARNLRISYRWIANCERILRSRNKKGKNA